MAPWLTVVGTLVLCGLVSGVAGQSANSQGDCSTIDVSYQVADIKPKSLRRRGRGETHVAVTNHKTGTVLSFCICTSLPLSKCIKSEGHDGSEFRIGTYGINFARDPFRIMASAYFYHLNTTESWANAPIQQSYHDGVTQALRAYNAWCHPDKPEISMDRTSTFSTVMRSLPMKYGLILEALMLVDVNMGNMMTATHRCAAVQERASQLEGDKAGGCVTVLLDEIMADYPKAWTSVLAPAFHIPADKANNTAQRFEQRCNPKAVVSAEGNHELKDAQQHHATSYGTERLEALEILEEIDAEFFGGTLQKAKDDLNKLATHIE